LDVEAAAKPPAVFGQTSSAPTQNDINCATKPPAVFGQTIVRPYTK